MTSYKLERMFREIRPGDHVAVWRSGPDAGVFAFSEIGDGEPYETEASRRGWLSAWLSQPGSAPVVLATGECSVARPTDPAIHPVDRPAVQRRPDHHAALGSQPVPGDLPGSGTRSAHGSPLKLRFGTALEKRPGFGRGASACVTANERPALTHHLTEALPRGCASWVRSRPVPKPVFPGHRARKLVVYREYT